MKFPSLVSLLGVAVALALTSAASAQTMVGSQSFSEGEMSAVRTHCNELAAAQPSSGAGAATPAAPAAPDAAPATGGAEGSAGAESPATGAAAGATGALDIAAITLEDCRAANLVQ
jgi:uncharacterized low-complexity protein